MNFKSNQIYYRYNIHKLLFLSSVSQINKAFDVVNHYNYIVCYLLFYIYNSFFYCISMTNPTRLLIGCVVNHSFVTLVYIIFTGVF